MKDKTHTTQPEYIPNHDNLLQKINQLENLNYVMAHNLRGAAGNIRMLTDILLTRNIANDANEFSIAEILDCINRSSDALVNTLEGMMSTLNKKLEQREEFVECDVEDIVTNVTTQLNGIILQKKAKVILQLGIKNFSYIRVYVESLIYNLISNALKYSRDNVSPVINIFTYLDSGNPVLEISDNGRGIDMKKNRHRLFRRKQSFHENADSNGLGLFITKQHIEALGGTITVSSRVNKGTRFIITL